MKKSVPGGDDKYAVLKSGDAASQPQATPQGDAGGTQKQGFFRRFYNELKRPIDPANKPVKTGLALGNTSLLAGAAAYKARTAKLEAEGGHSSTRDVINAIKAVWQGKPVNDANQQQAKAGEAQNAGAKARGAPQGKGAAASSARNKGLGM